MQRHVSPATHFDVFDLRSGQRVRLGLGYFADCQHQTLSVMLASQASRCTVPFNDWFCVESKYDESGLGVAAVGLAAMRDIGPVQAGTLLAFGSCSVSQFRSDEAFGYACRNYVAFTVAHGAPSITLSPPTDYPWAAFFLSTEAAALDEATRYPIIETMRTCLAATVNHCRQALARNDDPVLDGGKAAGEGDDSGDDFGDEVGPNIME